MATMDMQGDGSLDYEEFLAATVATSKLETEENLLQARNAVLPHHARTVAPALPSRRSCGVPCPAQ